MKNTIRLRSNYMNMMVNNYINHHNNADSSYMITRTEYDFIKHSEIKLYNNVVKYLQEHTGDFQELYIQLTTKFCEMLLEPINEYGLSDDHSDSIVLYEAIQNQLITPEQIRNVKELVIEPKFNPRQMCKEHIIKLMQDNELLQDIEDQIDDIATKIENACYNHVIQYCRNSDISYQIKWTSNTFIERYQDRISVILNHLNYDSITNQTYDHVVVKKLYLAIYHQRILVLKKIQNFAKKQLLQRLMKLIREITKRLKRNILLCLNVQFVKLGVVHIEKNKLDLLMSLLIFTVIV